MSTPPSRVRSLGLQPPLDGGDVDPLIAVGALKKLAMKPTTEAPSPSSVNLSARVSRTNVLLSCEYVLRHASGRSSSLLDSSQVIADAWEMALGDVAGGGGVDLLAGENLWG